MTEDEIRNLPYPTDNRPVETGLVKFGGDLPSIHITGEDASVEAWHLARIAHTYKETIGESVYWRLIALADFLDSCGISKRPETCKRMLKRRSH